MESICAGKVTWKANFGVSSSLVSSSPLEAPSVRLETKTLALHCKQIDQMSKLCVGWDNFPPSEWVTYRAANIESRMECLLDASCAQPNCDLSQTHMRSKYHLFRSHKDQKCYLRSAQRKLAFSFYDTRFLTHHLHQPYSLQPGNDYTRGKC